jgi:hypothetical protein
MLRDHTHGIRVAQEIYKQVLIVIFKGFVFALAIAGWLIGLLKKWTR